MGLKVFSKQFRDSVLQLNLATPPDIVAGLSDLVGGGMLNMYRDSLGKDAEIRTNNADVTVRDPGTIESISPAFRLANLNKNLTTPQDVFQGINDLSPTAAAATQYLSGRGADTVIHDMSVNNPGTVDTYADVEIVKLLNKNIVRNQNDPSQSDMFIFGQGYSYSSLIAGIGKPTTINDYSVQNLASVTYNPNITPEVQWNLAIQQNRFMPTEPNQFEVVVNQLASVKEPYVNLNTGNFSRYQAEEYQPSEFIGGSAATGTAGQLSSRTQDLLKTDTVLMNIAAMELKFNFENRIKNALERETLGRTKIDEALTNPLTAIEILRDPLHNLFERDWEITQAPGILGKAASLAARIAGTEIPVDMTPESHKVLMPGNFNKVVVSDYNETLLRYTGGGQKFALQANLAFNKYTPIFAKKRNAGQYVGGENGNPLSLDNVEKLSHDYEPNINDVDLSKHGSIKTNFAWVGKLTETSSGIQEISSYSRYKQLFKNGSILATTQEILDNLDDQTDVAKTAIDQTKTKLDDGYRIMSRGSGVLGISVSKPVTENGSTHHNYTIPSRDRKGMVDAELCRVWTKKRPYHQVSDAIRYKELIRKERNSVIDRFGNYNIFPSDINVNEGYGRPGNGIGDATVEAFGEKRARKYMFSLENLAWRDSSQFNELPSCEKGSNGGRIMWFPPYDIQFSEDNSANWTTHMFLGRPEPIYTFNNTERSGNLSFKIVVDHPSILNTLVKYELASLSDEEVDEVLSSFWAGCVEYDVFELARIWGVLSDQDISFFKDVIADLDPQMTKAQIDTTVNEALKKNAEITNQKQPPKSNINGHALYFENDVPFPEQAWTPTNFERVNDYFTNPDEKKKFFQVKPFDKYFKVYTDLATNQGNTTTVLNGNGKIDVEKSISAAALKSYLYYDASIRTHYQTSASFIDYSQSIGMQSPNNYFFSQETPSTIYGFTKQAEIIAKDIADNKYDGFELEIKCAPYASPINADSYNKELADRRFRSVAQWIALEVLKYKTPKLKDGTLITAENVATIISGNKAEFYKNDKELVTITTNPGKERNNSEIKEELKKEISALVEGGDYFKVPYKGQEYKCYFSKGMPASPSDTDGNLEPADSAVRRNADLVCADLSIAASRSRRVNVTVIAKPITKIETTTNSPKQVEINYKKAGANVTKREIAQRLLNKLVTECDYFDYLKEKSPVVYSSLKEKLKYFQPSFHAITPEGLNSRLTFLQQCLRPGETIHTGTGGCDAVNTSFGKPPICVLRIGDLYNTKIAIQNLSINYEPLIWDLNPEGIGAQPMLASVNLSFKYIGGSGLRKYVDQLQNALSFNFYANTDMYDERTFANTDVTERNLINLEGDFFNAGTLDLEKIVDLESIKPNMPEMGGDQATMIGKLVETLPLHMAGGSYYTTQVAPSNYTSNTVYTPYSLVVWPAVTGDTYERQNINLDSYADPSDSTIWKLQVKENYGEEAYVKEYGRNYISMFKVDYQDAFKAAYQSYIESLGAYVGVYNEFLKSNSSPLMMNFLMKQKYGATTTGSTFTNAISSGFATGMTTEQAYAAEAVERNYKPYYEVGAEKINTNEIMKLHLYPQDKFYKMTNGLALDYPTAKVDPGPFQGIYLKDKLTVFDHEHTKTYFNYHLATLTQKIDHDMLNFMSKNESVFNSYMSDFYEFDRAGLRGLLQSKLADYDASIESYFEATAINVRGLSEKITNAAREFHKLSVVLNGNDGILDKYAEIVPNGTQVTDIKKIFSYDPYENFPIVQFETDSDNASVVSEKIRTYELKDVRSVVVNKDTTSYKKFLRLGNGTYFFKQMANNDAYFNNVSTANDLSGTKLPYLYVLGTGAVPTGGTVNYRTGTGLYVGPASGNTTNAYDPTTPHKIKTVFEKMSYEILDFSNRTLSVMINDTIADTTTTFDTDIDGNEVGQQLSTILGGLFMTEDEIGVAVNTIVGSKPLYHFKFVTTGTTIPVDLLTELSNLNTNLSFKFKLTPSYVATYNKNSDNNPLPNGVINSTLDINYYDELLLLGFYENMLADGVFSLTEEFKRVLNVAKVQPKAGLNNREQKDYIKQMTDKRTRTAEALVNQLDEFVQKAKADMSLVDTVNKQKVEDFSTNARKALFDEDFNTKSLADDNFPALAEKLMKKVDGTEYTLLMRQTSSVDARTKSLLNKLYNA